MAKIISVKPDKYGKLIVRFFGTDYEIKIDVSDKKDKGVSLWLWHMSELQKEQEDSGEDGREKTTRKPAKSNAAKQEGAGGGT